MGKWIDGINTESEMELFYFESKANALFPSMAKVEVIKLLHHLLEQIWVGIVGAPVSLPQQGLHSASALFPGRELLSSFWLMQHLAWPFCII